MNQLIEFNVGTDFSSDVLRTIINLNHSNVGVRVTELYGSLRSEHLGLFSARPDFRLSNCDGREFEKFVRMAMDSEIHIDYTINASFTQSVDEYKTREPSIIDSLHYLEDMGIKRVIVANPLMMEIISEKSNLKIKVSTILGVNRASAIKYYSQYNVDRICADIYINRNIPAIKTLVDEASKYGIMIELLANEGCFYGDSPCEGILRSSCYAHSSLGGNQTGLYNNWPFERCQKARRENPICWLKIPYILPQHINFYLQSTGVRHYKITGRTNTHEYLLKTLGYYMQLYYGGKIPELFMLPQNVPSGSADIYADELEESGFFRRLFSYKTCDYRCEHCGLCEYYAKQLNICT